MASRLFLPNILFVLAAAVIGAIAWTFLQDMDGPTFTISPQTRDVSRNTVLQIAMDDPSGIRELSVGVRRNNNFLSFFVKHYENMETQRVESVPMAEAPLTHGAFELEVRVVDGSMAGFGQGNTRTELIPMRLDNTPPRITIRTMPASVYRGGAGSLVYTVDEDVSATGVSIGGYFVPSFRQEDGSWVNIYPFPFTMSAPDFKKNLSLIATDMAGNTTQARFTVMAYEKRLRNDKLTITDSFLQNVQAKLGHLVPEATSPLQCYLTINSKIRAANMEFMRSLHTQSAQGRLWSGVFQAMPRASARAGFADRRALIYNGEMVGEVYHLGLDLASVRNDRIPAANAGTVIYAGDLGIYGNVVIIDHGLGVMSVYSHMSEIGVSKGQAVTRGTYLGRTGTTGLAFGDHLHFGMLVGGLEVNPLEWLDPRWMDNLVKRLNAQ